MTNIVPKIDLQKISFLSKSESRQNEVLEFVEEWNNEQDFIVAKTSGSTGIPKEIKLLKKKCLISAEMTGKYFNFKKNETLILCLSTETIGGKMVLVRALRWDLQVIVLENERNPLKETDLRAKMISLVPYQLEEVLRSNPENLNGIETVLLGGSAVSGELILKMKMLKPHFYESFGMTESISHIALKKLNHSDGKSYFEALEGVRFTSSSGQLQIHAPELGIEELKTSDVVEIIDEKHFNWLGRADFAINSAGYKFHPEMLERKLNADLPCPFFIIGEKHPEFGQLVTLYVESTYKEELEVKINEICRNLLEKYEIPKKIYFAEAFEKAGNGKINRLLTQKRQLES